MSIALFVDIQAMMCYLVVQIPVQTASVPQSCSIATG
jgi:hypothetical protein